MTYCSQCGSPVAGRFCASCGKDSEMPVGVTIAAPVKVGLQGMAAQPLMAREPGYVAPVTGTPMQSMGATAANRFTHDAERLLRSTGERIAWQGKPSLIILMPRVVGWAVMILLSMMLAGAIRQGGGWVLFFLLMAALHLGAGYLNWLHTTYRITSQRLEYSSGVFSCSTAASPLSQIGNVTIRRPFPWNLMGLGHIELDIPDQAARGRAGARPKVMLKCLQHLETTRDLIHSSSTITNQAWDQRRFGA
jgi:hypothetical protein